MHSTLLTNLSRSAAAHAARLRRAAAPALGRYRRTTAGLLLRLGTALADAPNQEKGKTDMDDHEGVPATPSPESPEGMSRQEVVKTLARAVVSIWRAKRRLRKEADDSQDARMALRHLDQAWSMIEALGIEARDDFEGQKYTVGGYFVQPFSFEERPDLTEETIIEVTAPAVLIDGRLAHKSEVIVGRPPASPELPPPVEAKTDADAPIAAKEAAPATKPEPAAGEQPPPTDVAEALLQEPAAEAKATKKSKPPARKRQQTKPRPRAKKPQSAKAKRPTEPDSA